MALGINQVTYSDRKFCRSVCPGFATFGHFQVSWDDKIREAYQGPDQIKLEIVVSPNLPYVGEWGGGSNSEKIEKMKYF